MTAPNSFPQRRPPIVSDESLANISPPRLADDIRAAVEVIPLRITIDQDISRALLTALDAEKTARPLLMRLPEPDSNIAYENFFEARAERFMVAARRSEITRGDAQNLSLLGSEVRDCLVCKAIPLFNQSMKRFEAVGLELSNRAIWAVDETNKCLTAYRYDLAPATFELRKHLQRLPQNAPSCLLDEVVGQDGARVLSEGLLTAVYGVGVHCGASAYTMNYQDFERESEGRESDWKRDLGDPVEERALGTDTANKLSASVSKLNEIDLGSMWAGLVSRISPNGKIRAFHDGKNRISYDGKLAVQEMQFIVNSAERQKDMTLLYTGCLMCGVLKELEDVYGLDPSNRAFERLNSATGLIYDALRFRGAMVEIDSALSPL